MPPYLRMYIRKTNLFDQLRYYVELMEQYGIKYREIAAYMNTTDRVIARIRLRPENATIGTAQKFINAVLYWMENDR